MTQNPYLDEMNFNRMLVLIEDINDGSFSQFIFTKEQFKKVSNLVASFYRLTGVEGEYQMLETKSTTRTIPNKYFDGFQDYYEDTEPTT